MVSKSAVIDTHTHTHSLVWESVSVCYEGEIQQWRDFSHGFSSCPEIFLGVPWPLLTGPLLSPWQPWDQHQGLARSPSHSMCVCVCLCVCVLHTRIPHCWLQHYQPNSSWCGCHGNRCSSNAECERRGEIILLYSMKDYGLFWVAQCNM